MLVCGKFKLKIDLSVKMTNAGLLVALKYWSSYGGISIICNSLVLFTTINL